MKFTVISDTHSLHDNVKVAPADVLLHCGDFTSRGRVEEVAAFNDWLGEQDFQYKVIIAGNHDFLFENDPELARQILTNATYLEDTEIVLNGIKIYGSPWQPWFHDWAFNLQRGEKLVEKWALIPADTDILLTHGPPHGIGDETIRGEMVGCEDLKERVDELNIKYHCFGHIHEDPGIWEADGTVYMNASICNLNYDPLNPCMTFEL